MEIKFQTFFFHSNYNTKFEGFVESDVVTAGEFLVKLRRFSRRQTLELMWYENVHVH